MWPGVLEKDCMWAHADQGSYKMALRKAYKNNDEMLELAAAAQGIIDTKFRDEVLYKLFVDNILGFDSSIIDTNDDDTVLEFE